MYYKTGYCFSARDLFDNISFDSVGLSSKVYKGKYYEDSIRNFSASVFLYFMLLVIMDIIENNVTFVLPLKGNRRAMIHVKTFSGDDFVRLYQQGKFDGIDFLNSMFKGYQLCFRYNYREGEREKPIYINQKLKDIFYQHINEGKQYY